MKVSLIPNEATAAAAANASSPLANDTALVVLFVYSAWELMVNETNTRSNGYLLNETNSQLPPETFGYFFEFCTHLLAIAESLNETNNVSAPSRLNQTSAANDAHEDTISVARLPGIVKAIFVLLLLLISLGSVVGNLCVVYVTLGIRTVVGTGRFLICLAITDLLQTITICATETSNIINDLNWVFGGFLCKLLPSLQTAAALCNAEFVSAIALARFFAVLVPLKRRKSSAITITAIIIVFCIVVCSPISFFFEQQSTKADPDGFHYCMWRWDAEEAKKIYFFVTSCLLFLPLAILIITIYAYMACYLWLRVELQVSQRTQTQQRKWRTIKNLALLVLAFIVCRTPVQVFSVIHSIQKFKLTGAVLVIRYCLITLKLLSCALNPLLHSLLSVRVKAYLLTTIHRIRQCVAVRDESSIALAEFGANLYRQPRSSRRSSKNNTSKSLPLSQFTCGPAFLRGAHGLPMTATERSWHQGQSQTLERLIQYEPHSV